MRGTFCLVLLAAGVALSAQQPARPIFKTGVNAVVMDVRVVDSDGRFITDLTKDDFQVFEDGREQTITTFELVDLPTPRQLRPLSAAAPPSDVSSNAGLADGRLYVIVLDDLYGHTPQVMPHIVEGIQGQPSAALSGSALARELIMRMSENDRAAVVTTGGRRDMAQEFTNDRGRLLALVDREVANQGQSPSFPEEASIYARPSVPRWDGRFTNTVHDAIMSVRDIGNWLSGIEGRRKAIILISQRLYSTGGNLTLTNWSRNRGLQDLMTPYHMRSLIEATSRANVTIYTLNPLLSAAVDPFERRDTDFLTMFPDEYREALAEARRSPEFATLAQATGGFSAIANFDGVFDRIVAETGSYYLVGFTSSVGGEDGKFHRVEVRTRFTDLGVRTRAGYVSSSPKPVLSRAMIPRNTPMPLAEALQSPASMTGLTMSMSAAAYRVSGSKASLSILVELGDVPPSADVQTSATPIEIAIAAAQVNGKADDVRRIAIGGGTVIAQLGVKPGRYHVRVGAFDTDSTRRGSLLYDIEVPDFSARPLTMSGVTLTSIHGASTVVNGSDQRWKDQLGTPPTTRRAFSTDEVLRGHVEVYDNSRRSSSEIEVVATVRDESGEPVLTRSQKSVVSRIKGKLAPHQVRAGIPLADLHAGSFVLVVEASRPDGKDVVGSRLIPFTIK